MRKKFILMGAALFLTILIGTSCFSQDEDEYYSGWTYSHDEAQSPAALEERLKASIKEGMSLDEMLTAFEEMCQYPVEDIAPEDELLLFESGTFSFDIDETPLFYFSVARQFPNGEDEFYQVRLDVTYAPKGDDEKLEMSVWNDEVDQNFFAYIRESEVYQSLCEEPYVKVEVYMDET